MTLANLSSAKRLSVALTLLFLLFAFLSAPVAAQQEDEVPPPPVEDIEEPVLEDLPMSDIETDLIDEILSRGEEALESGQVYDPADRRDPFRSLVRITMPPTATGPRSRDKDGLLIEELTVTGIWQTRGGPVAQVQSSDNPVSFLLNEGDQLFDGEVLAIRYVRGEGGEVVFRQVVQDPDAPRPFREVTKRLNP
ncbi:MAG TPA: hypothetical protein VNB06_02220 [Thermoanaerobaculia bacterium]|nr:hypothetical protein [Thermoanaerobaculia bacterium]